MKHHFDFLINEEKDFQKTALRFYPKQSHVHGFEDYAPDKWELVYKTYMSFSILNYYKYEETDPYETPDNLFSYYGDEGEGLRILRDILKEMLSNKAKDEYSITPFGYGVDWEICKHKYDKNLFVFTMIDNLTNQAYRFYLEQSGIQEFHNVLNEFLEYMLAHSEGI